MSHTFVFQGAEHKVGCTMIAQSVAEAAAKANREIQVLFAALNGRQSAEFALEGTPSMDLYKMQLHSGIGIEKGLLKPCQKLENLFMVSGIKREEQARHYFPKEAEVFLDSLHKDFDMIIIDAGSELDNGLALGALQRGTFRYMVLEQSESSLGRFERTLESYNRLGIDFDKYMINKFVEGDPYTMGYIASRLMLDKPVLEKVSLCSSGRRAEMERKTLMELGEEKYKKAITKIANDMMIALNIGEARPQRKRKWKTFI